MKKGNKLLLYNIYNDILLNNRITEKELAIKYEVSERTIRRYIYMLKSNKLLTVEKFGVNKTWVINNYPK